MALPPTWLEANQHAKESQQVVFPRKKKPFVPLPQPTNPDPLFTPLKVHKLNRDEMVERQLKGLFYNYDEKCFLGHKSKEKKIFMGIYEDVPEEDVTIPLVEEHSLLDSTQEPAEPLEVDPLISLHALTGFLAPQTLQLIGYMKHRKFIILVDSGNTHNFIHRHISHETNCYIRVVNNFQIMIANGGSMKFGAHCENVCLQI
jgi:hypothetical protein